MIVILGILWRIQGGRGAATPPPPPYTHILPSCIFSLTIFTRSTYMLDHIHENAGSAPGIHILYMTNIAKIAFRMLLLTQLAILYALVCCMFYSLAWCLFENAIYVYIKIFMNVCFGDISMYNLLILIMDVWYDWLLYHVDLHLAFIHRSMWQVLYISNRLLLLVASYSLHSQKK